jgi:ferritin-like metal-binding protein YciE
MKLDNLNAMYLKELRELYHAENQIVKALPKMIEAAHSADLRTALENHLEETKLQINRLERVFEMHSEDPEGGKCKGMQGILEEGKEILGHAENLDVRDAGIIAGAQKVEHYEIASYGSVIAWAELLGHERTVQTLQQTLEEEKQADAKLTQISKSLNAEAVRHAG